MSKEHFKHLYKLAEEEGLYSALSYDKEVTEQRNTISFRLYKNMKRAFIEGYNIEGKWKVDTSSPAIDFALTPVKIVGGIARGITLPLEVLAKLLSDKKL